MAKGMELAVASGAGPMVAAAHRQLMEELPTLFVPHICVAGTSKGSTQERHWDWFVSGEPCLICGKTRVVGKGM